MGDPAYREVEEEYRGFSGKPRCPRPLLLWRPRRVVGLGGWTRAGPGLDQGGDPEPRSQSWKPASLASLFAEAMTS